jgi:hypothetical protein
MQHNGIQDNNMQHHDIQHNIVSKLQVFAQKTSYNDTACENQQIICLKWYQVKVEWGISGREGERDRESRLKEWEMEHRRGPKIVWVGNDL